MRPVKRGIKPPNLQIRDYNDAGHDLRNRLGFFCSYCEKALSDITDIEHVQPKKHFPERALEWDNLLLACSLCNRIKGTKPLDELDNYVFPDRDNPMLYLLYEENRVPVPRPDVDPVGRHRIENTIELVGLGRDDATDSRASEADRRWKQRRDVWLVAKEIRCICIEKPWMFGEEIFEIALREAVVGRGFFSVWMAVFEEFPAIRKMIIGFMPGTALDCFDQNGNAVIRP